MKEANFPPQLSAVHITERIIALVFPSEDQETTYKSSVSGVFQMLDRKHEDNYLVINLSERRNDMHKMHKQVIDYGWPSSLAPPLERLCTVCKSIDSFLNAAPQNVVVLHCKGGLGRLAVVLSAYIDFSNIYSNEEQSLDAYGMKNFYENKLTTYVQPSQRRYIHYFAGLLSGGISINNNSLFLHQIIIRGLPGNSTMQPYIKIYQGMNPIYVSGVFTTSSHTSQIIVTLDPCLQLRSDVLVKCFNNLGSNNSNSYASNNYNSGNNYHSNNNGNYPNNSIQGKQTDKDLIFRCQFHTCAINKQQLKLGKGDLDVACEDSIFPAHAQVEFVLSDSTYNWNRYECPPQEHNILIGTSPESMERCNSYEDFQGAQEDSSFDALSMNNFGLNEESHNRNFSSVQQQQKTYNQQQQNEYQQQQQKTHNQQQQNEYQQQQQKTYNQQQQNEYQQQNFQVNHTEPWIDENDPSKSQYKPSGPQYNSARDSSYQQNNQLSSYQQQDYSQQQQHLQQQQQQQQQQLIQQHQLQHRANSASAMTSSSVIPSQNPAEQQQLDEILKELIENQSTDGALVMNSAAPSHGVITTSNNNLTTTLSWNSTQAGATKSAVVSKQTWARPAPHTNLSTQVTRSREVLEEGDRVTGGRVTSNENYQYRMPQFEESRKVNMLAEDRVFDVNSASYRDYKQNDSFFERTHRGTLQEAGHKAVHESDTEDQAAWLESQRNKLRDRRIFSKTQSDTEDYEGATFQRRANDPATYHSTNLLPSHQTHVAEYRDAKGRRCRTIETETFSKRCETTTNQAAHENNQAVQQNNHAALMPPARSSTPSTPLIPERLDCSREAYLRNQYALKPFAESRSLSRLGPEKPVEVEVVELQPIGPGVQTLEPSTAGTILRKTAIPSLQYNDKARTLPREYNMTSSNSMPGSLSATLLPREQTQSFSKTDSYQSNMLVPASSNVNPSFLQTASYNGTMPGSFIYHQPPQPVVQTIKETWTQTLNPGPKSAGAVLQQQTQPQTQKTPQQIQQHAQQIQQNAQQMQQNAQQSTVYHQTNSASSDGRTVPVFVQNNDGSVTAPLNNFNTMSSNNFNTGGSNNFNTVGSNYNSNTMSNFGTNNYNTLNSNIVVDKQQQQQNALQQQHVARQQHFQQQQQQQQNTLRSSSQSRLFVETPRNFSSGSSGVFQNQAKSANVGNLYTMSAADRFHQSGGGGGGGTSTMVAGTGSSYAAGRSRTGSFSSVAGDGYDYVNQFPRYVKDTSHLWHRPAFSRDDAIQYLKDKEAGSFLIRNSATYQGSYGLTMRVSEVPENVVVLSDNPELNLVRHFVIEQTSKGVQLKGSPNEPSFASLGAFVYQHSITPISLPCKLLLPEAGDDVDAGSGSPSVARDVLYITSLDTESLTGPEALAKALQKTFTDAGKLPKSTEVNFKASSQGITITDNKRKDFFRKHYPLNSITYLGLDNQDQKWPVADHDGKAISSGRVFGFVARKQATNHSSNHCHLFSEVSSSQQPAQQLINFITRIMVDQGRTVTTTST